MQITSYICRSVFIVAISVLAGCTSSERKSATAEPSAGTSGSAALAPASRQLTPVTDKSLVCMVNNQFMGTPQIPVDIAGRVYFGCCEMCKGKLAKDPAARTATDPVSGKEVDKSAATLGRRDDGKVLYFESEANLRNYREQP